MASLWDSLKSLMSGEPTQDVRDLKARMEQAKAAGTLLKKDKPEARPAETPEVAGLQDLLSAPTPPVSAPETKSSALLKTPDFSKLESLVEQKAGTKTGLSPEERGARYEQWADQLSKQAQVRAEADPSYREHAKALTDAQNQIETVKEQMAGAENKTQWLSALEQIGHALTQYAAAKYGRDRGLNLSGLQLQKTDWDRILDRTLNRLEGQVAQLKEQQRQALVGQTDIAAREQGLARGILGERLRAEEEAQRAEERGLEARIGLEKEKLEADVATQKFNLQQQLQDELASAKEAGRTEATETDRVRKIEDDLIKAEARRLEQANKALNIVQGLRPQLEASGKDKAKAMALVSRKLGEAGLDPSVVQQTVGLFGQRKELDPEQVGSLVQETKAALQQRVSQLGEHRKAVAKAKSLGELERLREQTWGPQPTEASPEYTDIVDIATGAEFEVPTKNLEAALASGKYRRK